MPQKAKPKKPTKKQARPQPERALPTHPNITIQNILHFHWIPRPHVLNLEPSVAKDLFFDYPIQPQESAWFCAYCFTCFKTQKKATKHYERKCHLESKTPGTLTYSRDNIELREIDPIFEKEYCTKLAGYSKLVLQEENIPVVSEDLEHHVFYVLVKKQDYSNVVVGLFTRDKGVNNQLLSKMLVFTPYRRQGFGRLILEIAHGISVARKCIGHPELPWPRSFMPMYVNFIITTIAKHVLENEQFFQDDLRKFMMFVADHTGLHPLRIAEFLIAHEWINEDASLNLEKIKMEEGHAMQNAEFFLKFDPNCLTLPRSRYFAKYQRYFRISDFRFFVPMFYETLADGKRIAVIEVYYDMWLHVQNLMKKSSKGFVEKDGMSCSCAEPGFSGDGPCECQQIPIEVV